MSCAGQHTAVGSRVHCAVKGWSEQDQVLDVQVVHIAGLCQDGCRPFRVRLAQQSGASEALTSQPHSSTVVTHLFRVTPCCCLPLVHREVMICPVLV